jgi:hypothetical protein
MIMDGAQRSFQGLSRMSYVIRGAEGLRLEIYTELRSKLGPSPVIYVR